LPPGKSFSFILEKDKYEKIKVVIEHNCGVIVSENEMNDDIQLKVEKVAGKEKE
jgi:hypothetical protein